MNTSIYLKHEGGRPFEFHSQRTFEVLPRADEFISVGEEASRSFFQVVALHYPEQGNIEIYAIHAEPSWEYKRPGNIGFSFK
jgi:hypothetical protein